MFATFASSSLFSAWLSGTATGLGMFVVVGAQSAFILKQGLMRAHLFSILAVCAITDFLMIFASVLGLQALLAWLPGLTEVIRWVGVAFLSWYGLQSALRAWRAGSQGNGAHAHACHTRRAAIAGALAFTLLNPHFWLDMVVVGSLAQAFSDARLGFALGATTASVVWLAALGYGSRLLSPLFANPRAWRVLDSCVAVIMLVLAAFLAARPL